MAIIRTVLGDINAQALGATLPHEHLLVGFSPEGVTPDQYKDEEVLARMLPFLRELKAAGGQALVECTPVYMGRDLPLWRRFSQESGIHIVGSTGAYFEPCVPDYVRKETPEQLAQRWIQEAKEGVDGVQPGFVKIGMSGKAMTPIERNVLRAAMLTSVETGLVIAAHCPAGQGMQDAIEMMRIESFPPEHFIWVHADVAWWADEQGRETVYTALGQGMWVELDTIGSRPYQEHVALLHTLFTPEARLLISQDAGWYEVGNEAREPRAFALLFTEFLPLLAPGMAEILLVRNPANAFRIR